MESGGGLLLLGIEVDRAEDVDDQAESRGIHVADGADADDIDKVNVEADAHDHGQNHCDGSSLVIDALPEEAQQNRNRYNGAKGVGADLEGRCDVGNDNCDQGDQRCTAGNDDTADTEQGLVAPGFMGRITSSVMEEVSSRRKELPVVMSRERTTAMTMPRRPTGI